MKKWEKKLVEVKELRKRSAGLVYDRVKLLVDVYNDPEFRLDAGDKAIGRLDAELGDTCADFLALKAVYEFYPERKQWEGRRLQEVVAEVLEAERRKTQVEQERPKPRRATVAELEKLEQENASLREANSQLREENQELREEIGALNYRLKELESFASVA